MSVSCFIQGLALLLLKASPFCAGLMVTVGLWSDSSVFKNALKAAFVKNGGDQ